MNKVFRKDGFFKEDKDKTWYPNLFSVIVNRYLTRKRNDKKFTNSDDMIPIFQRARRIEFRFRKRFGYDGI